MDELQMIREAYGEPEPPTLKEMTEARAAMLGTPPRTGVRFGWRLKAGIGLVAAGAAAAVAITAVGSGPPAPPSPPAAADPGRRAVLAAAERAEAQPAGGYRGYWYSDTVDGQSYVIRAKSGTYAISAMGTQTFQWIGEKRGMGEAFFIRRLPARPVSAQDRALWKRAGSPSEFRVWLNDHYATCTTEATGWRSSGPGADVDPKGGGKFYELGHGGSSVEDVRNLPSDPSELAEKFLSRTAIGGPRQAEAKPPRKKASDISDEELPHMQLRRAMSILTGPLPPKTRGGLMRALAAQPGVHALGRVTDPLGRPGVALATGDRSATVGPDFGTPKAEQGTYAYRRMIVFDERTGAPLSLQEELTRPGGPYAEMQPGFVISYEAQRGSGWSDARPKPPAKPPF